MTDECPRHAADLPMPPAPVAGRPPRLEDLDELREGSDVHYDPKAKTWIFTRWKDVHPTLLDLPIERSLAAHESMKKLWARVLEQRKTKPERDFISPLVDGHDQERLSESELQCMLQVTFAAGNISTAHMISNTMALLLENPAEPEKLRLRCEPVVVGAGRIAPEALEVRGCAIGAGEMIILNAAAAARDPKVNPDPTDFDVTRTRPSSSSRVCCAAFRSWRLIPS